MIFDTLAFAHRLKAAGFSDAQAEALAEANREMIAGEMVTTTTSGGLARTVQIDATGGGTASAPVFDHITSDTTIDPLRNAGRTFSRATSIIEESLHHVR